MADPTLIIDAEPNWRDLPEIGYSFATAIQGTPRFLEQRRPLLPTPERSISCRYGLETENAQRLLNILLSGSSQLCCIPIYSEPLFAGTITQGASSITVETDLTYLWNVKNCDYLILLDYVTGVSEMLKISSVVGQVITLAAVIVGSWVAAQTVMYPAMAGIIKEVKRLDLSGRVSSFGVEFAEAAVGEESGKSWVGLDEQVCPEETPAVGCGHSFDGTGSGIDSSYWWGAVGAWRREGGVAILEHTLPLPDWQIQGDVINRFYFNGAFDVQLDWSIENVDGTINGGWLNFFPDELNCWAGLYFGWQADDYGLMYFVDGSVESGTLDSNHRSGKVRLTRSAAGEVKFYYWNPSLLQWEWNGSTSGAVIEPGATGPTSIYIESYIQVTDDFETTSPIIRIDNFVVNIGCDDITPW